MSEHDLKREMDERYREAFPMWNAFWVQADLDTRIAMGDQSAFSRYWSPNTRINRELYFNKILRILNMVSGYQRKNRLTSIVTAIENDDEETADDLSGVLQWCMQTADSYNTISDAFEHSIQCGLNMLSVWMDYRTDLESGDIKCDRIGYNSFIMDPFWTKPDLSDCSWIWTRKWLSQEAVGGLYPEIEDELDQMRNAPSNYNNRGQDMKFLFQPQATYQKIKDMFAYDEYWVREHREVYRILDEVSGEVANWPHSKAAFYDFKKNINPFVRLLKNKVPSVARHVLVNGHLVHSEKRPWGLDRFPFVPVITYHSPDIMYYEYRLQGIVRTLRDSQLELNRRRNKMLDILDSQVNSGMVVKEDALVRPDDAFLTGQGRVLFVKDTANIQTDIQHIPPPPTPVGDMDMQTLLEKELMENAGTTEELFGKSDAKSGFQEQMRQGAAIVGLQGIFDRLNLAQKNLGNIFLDLIQENFSEQKVARILNKQPSQQFFEGERERKFDCVVEQGLLTSTQRQMEFAQLMELKQMGMNIPDDLLLQKSTLQGKKDLVDAIQKQQEAAAQQQQMQMQLELEKLRSEANVLESNAENMRAAARERETRAVSNIGLAQERIAQAEQDRAQASLDNAKAIREIQELDISNLTQIAALLQNLQAKQEVKQNIALKGTEAEAGAVGAKAQRK